MSLVPVPGKLNFTMYQGSDFDFAFQLKLSGVPADFTGCSAHMQASRSLTDAAPIFSLSTDTGGITLDANGWARGKMPGAATAAVPAGILRHDIDVIWSDGSKWTIVAGQIVVTAQVPESKP